MPRGYWSVIAPIIGCLVVALIPAAYLAGYAQSESAQSERSAYVAQSNEAVEREADREAFSQKGIPLQPGWPVVLGNATVEKADCAKSENCRSEQRDYSDLKAQWRAADAAYGQYVLAWGVVALSAVGTILAFVGTILAFVGTVFVIGAYRETKRSADAAHDANRPWLEIKTAEVALVIEETGVKVSGTCLIENRGNSPATDVLVYSRLVAMPLGFADPIVATDKVRNILDNWSDGAPKDFGICIFPGAEETRDVRAILTPQQLAYARGDPPTGVFYTVAIGVRYSFAGRHGQTVKPYDLYISGSAIAYSQGVTEVIPKTRITLKSLFGGYAT